MKKEEKARKEEEKKREKEEKAKKEEQRRKQEAERREEWVSVTNKRTGEVMLKSRITGEVIEGPSAQASGYGLRGF